MAVEIVIGNTSNIPSKFAQEPGFMVIPLYTHCGSKVYEHLRLFEGSFSNIEEMAIE